MGGAARFVTIPVSCCLPRCMSNCVIILSWHAAGSAASAASCIPPPPPSTCPSLSHLASQFSTVRTPYLLLHGQEDKICSPEGSKDFHKLSASEDKTLQIVESGLHNLYLERGDIRDKAISDTMAWIESRRGDK